MGRGGWEGWDEYAPFYDWENARTLGRRDVTFWRRRAAAVEGRVLELGSGTGRVSLPLARAGIRLVGVDRSAAMLRRARERSAKASRYVPPSRDVPPPPSRAAQRFSGALQFVRADIRALPFADRTFGMVLAPYGMLQ